MFSDIILQFNKYRRKLLETEGLISFQDAELGKRLMQLNWLINKSKFLNNTFMHNPKTPNFEILEELEIITETFYHFAWRVEEIIKHHPKFNMGNTNIRRVRNNLIQHPEKERDKQKASLSFEIGDDNGPKIKSYKGPENSYQDEGLFVNAQDFIKKFPQLL
ncbi:MAG: hypothetical protein HOG05_01715 [Bacteroidetes bacterium]|jgi:hypothetical protein|nr:hypothetical protein [Bacteroidota bacterium]MBT4730307.1 hypothetical protein [Bacteroidota bacterium]MBT6835157.1 hypothetical protein [Bacteroidota bacterium]